MLEKCIQHLVHLYLLTLEGCLRFLDEFHFLVSFAQRRHLLSEIEQFSLDLTFLLLLLAKRVSAKFDITRQF